MCKKQTAGTLPVAFTLVKLTMLVGSAASLGSAAVMSAAFMLPVIVPLAVLGMVGMVVLVVKTPTITYGRLATVKTKPAPATTAPVIEQVQRPAIEPVQYAPDPLLEVVDAELVEEAARP